jgi:F-type H+-transporting ATPase subunit b
MSLLVPDTGLLFWTTLSFGVVFFILAKFGFPLITKAVEKRADYINGALEAAREAEEKLNTVNQQAEKIIDKANSERNAILHEAQEIKSHIMDKAKATADAEAQARIARASIEIEASKKRAIREARNEIALISVKIAEKIVGEQLRDDTKQQELINKLINEEIKF